MRYTPRYGPILLLCSLIMLLSAGCPEQPAECQNGIHPSTIDPGKSPCKTDCECNNQNYAGICLKGNCISERRDKCETTGNFEKKCTPKVARPACSPGVTRVRICKDKGLNVANWGDCRCDGKAEPHTEASEDEPDNPDEKSQRPEIQPEPRQEPQPEPRQEPQPELVKPDEPAMADDAGVVTEHPPSRDDEPAPEPTQEVAQDSGCPSGRSRCAATCVNLETNKTHCGKCNQACPSQEVCIARRCVVPGFVLHYGHISSMGCSGTSGCSPAAEGGGFKLYDASFTSTTAVHNPGASGPNACVGETSTSRDLCLIGGFSAEGL